MAGDATFVPLQGTEVTVVTERSLSGKLNSVASALRFGNVVQHHHSDECLSCVNLTSSTRTRALGNLG